MAQNHHRERVLTPPDNRIQNQPTPADSTSEETIADVDEPPDQQSTPRPEAPHFTKATLLASSQKLSALTRMLTSEEDESTDEDDEPTSPTSHRGFSTTSTWSNPSLTSDGLTSPDTRANTPSPPPPTIVAVRPVLFNNKPFESRPVVIKDIADSIGPLQKTSTPDSTATTFEAGLGRKRCIAFACGRKEAPKAEPTPEKKPEVKVEEPPKRKCMLTFACPSKKPSEEAPSAVRKPSLGRRPSPAPNTLKISKTSTNASPNRRRSTSNSAQPTVHKPARRPSTSRLRRLSTAGEVDTIATEHACQYAGNQSRTEDDDWMKERTCHRSRLTVNDTLKIEMGLRKLGTEAEEEEEIEDESELDNEGLESDDVDDGEDEDVDEEEDGAGELTATADDDESDAGFYSDDEGGMVDSDSDSDADSDYQWWAPGKSSTAATSYEQLDHMHFTRQRNMSGSSIGSLSSTRAISGDKPEPLAKRLKKRRAIQIRPRDSDLPDSTDFVCGTLDEDRPMEESYRREIEKRRAAKHRVCPQDIDPTFPTSDPEMDEEDDDDVYENHHDDSDVHESGVFGHFENDDVTPKPHLELPARSRRGTRGRSPVPSPPKRKGSPAPRRSTVHRSPPPRRLFGHSPTRLHSPPPATRLRSPPPSRRQSFAKSPIPQQIFFPSVALAERPRGQHPYSSSVPRKSYLMQQHRAPSPIPDAENDSGDDTRPNLPARGAIDIVKGLEKKRQFRKEKLYQKYCRQRANGSVKPKEEKRCLPGKGAERMREMGLELAGRLKGEKKYQDGTNTNPDDAQHILSL